MNRKDMIEHLQLMTIVYHFNLKDIWEEIKDENGCSSIEYPTFLNDKIRMLLKHNSKLKLFVPNESLSVVLKKYNKEIKKLQKKGKTDLEVLE